MAFCWQVSPVVCSLQGPSSLLSSGKKVCNWSFRESPQAYPLLRSLGRRVFKQVLRSL